MTTITITIDLDQLQRQHVPTTATVQEWCAMNGILLDPVQASLMGRTAMVESERRGLEVDRRPLRIVSYDVEVMVGVYDVEVLAHVATKLGFR